jgi:ankyrin repeat protein
MPKTGKTSHNQRPAAGAGAGSGQPAAKRARTEAAVASAVAKLPERNYQGFKCTFQVRLLIPTRPDAPRRLADIVRRYLPIYQELVALSRCCKELYALAATERNLLRTQLIPLAIQQYGAACAEVGEQPVQQPTLLNVRAIMNRLEESSLLFGQVRHNCLNQALLTGGLGDVQRILAFGVRVNLVTREYPEPALHWAFKAPAAGRLEKVQLLLQSGADVHMTDNLGKNSLLALAGSTDTTEQTGQLAQLLRGAGARLQADNNGVTALMAACRNHKPLSFIQWLLDAGVDPCASNATRYTALHQAVSAGSVASEAYIVQLVSRLLAAGTSPDGRSILGETAYDIACKRNLEQVKALLRPVTAGAT